MPRSRSSAASLLSLLALLIVPLLIGAAPLRASAPVRDDPPADREDDAPPDDAAPPGILAGPKVDEASATTPARSDRRPIPLRRWLGILRDLELSVDQTKEVRLVLDELERDTRTFRREHGAEIARLRRSIADLRAKDDGAGAREANRDLRALLEKEPSPETYQSRIFDLLTPEQQATMRERIQLIERAGAMRDGGDAMTMKAKDSDRMDVADIVDLVLADKPAVDEPARRRLRFLLKLLADASPAP